MPTKGTGPATDWREIDEWEGGTGWLAYPEEAMQRASHLLTAGDDVWLVDPVDVPDLDDLIEEYGSLRGVLLLLDRHKRDAGRIARRHDVPVYIPEWMDGVAGELRADVERIRREVPDSEYVVHRLVDNRFWQEALLYGVDSKTLVVPEAVGTSEFYRVEDERLGVSPVLRLTPPRRLRQWPPERILVGHGEGVFEDAEPVLLAALDGSRRNAPRVFVKTVRQLVG